MANSVFSQLIAGRNFKLYDEENNIAVWTEIKVKEIKITSEAQTAQNPMSDVYAEGTEQSEESLAADLESTKVIQPVSVVVNCYISSVSTTAAISQAFASQTKTYTIVAKGLTAQGMALTGVQINQSPEALSAIIAELTFEQAIIPNTTGYSPSSSSDSNTYGLSVDGDTDISATVESMYNKISSSWS